MEQNKIIKILENAPNFQEKLFARGFLLTDSDNIVSDKYPFLGSWYYKKIGNFALFTNKGCKSTIVEKGNRVICLVGHAYNPFSMVYEEERILNSLIDSECEITFNNTLSELTGIFAIIVIEDGLLKVYGDATGMLTIFYGSVNGANYISSHTKLIDDIAHPKIDLYAKQLIKYKFFRLLGNSLPGDLTLYEDIHRVIPNHYVLLNHQGWNVIRFYTPAKQKKANAQIATEVAQLLHNNLELISKKFKKPAISLTGGVDSKTTLACAKGLYEKFFYYSYISSDSEEVDAKAAHFICKAIGVDHTIYKIPQDDNDLNDIEVTREILNWNTGDIRYSNKNDVRKQRFFQDVEDFDVEVKSWASEVGRAYFSKRFNNRTDFGDHPTPRKCTTMYKFFFHNRKLVRKTDAIFKKYLEMYFQQDSKAAIEWQEQFFWEFRVPSWNGLNTTGEHKYSCDITIPYNNRKVLELLLSAPIKDRINDTIYSLIRQKMNPIIDETGVFVTNVKHTRNRAKYENIYYILHTHFPF